VSAGQSVELADLCVEGARGHDPAQDAERPAIEPAVYRSLGLESVEAATITFATTSGSSAVRKAVASTSREISRCAA
jgi:hypothetical protein